MRIPWKYRNDINPATRGHRPILGCSDTWQLVTNTSTTMVAFLMVVINRDKEVGRVDRSCSNSR
ncbi:low affinity iron permease family protein [Arthrobacter sp. UYCu723]